MLSVFGGGKLILNEDAELKESFDLYDDSVIDLNGHIIDEFEGYVDQNAEIIVIDSSIGKTGKIKNFSLQIHYSSLLLKDVELVNGDLTSSTDSTITLDGVSGDELEIYNEITSELVVFKNVELQNLILREYSGGRVLMDNLTIDTINVEETNLNELFESECTSVKDANGQEMTFESGAVDYEGKLTVTHDYTNVDETVWKNGSDGHWHECVCGYKADLTEHTLDGNKCSVCNAEAYISVIADGETASFFDMNKAFEYCARKSEATIKLHHDVTIYEYITIDSNNMELTIDLNGYNANIEYVNVYEDVIITVTDGSSDRNGKLSCESFNINDNVDFKILSGGFDGDVYIYNNSGLHISGGDHGELFVMLDGDGAEAIIDGGVFESIDTVTYDYKDFYILNAEITDSFFNNNESISEFFGCGCITVDVNGGPEFDATSDYYYCDGNVLKITHSDAFFSTDIQGNGGYHGSKCQHCDHIKDPVACSGGTATCSEKATCSVCGEKYGKTLPHTANDSGKCVSCSVDALVKVEGDGKTLYFFDLIEAFDEAAKLSKATITLLDNVECEDGSEIDMKGDIILDLNGKELYIDELNVYGKLVIDDLSSEYAYVAFGSTIDVYEGGYLIIETGDYCDDSVYIDLEDSGTVLELNGGEYYNLGIDFDAEDTLAIIDGIDVYWFNISQYAKGNLIIKSGTFDRMPEIEGDFGLDIEEILSAECITVYDYDGEPISVSDYLYGDITVEHNDDYEGDSYLGYKDGHCSACACGAPKDSTLIPHSGGEATCTKGKLCDDCGYEYTDEIPHAFENGVCTVCGGRELVKVEAEGFSQSYDSIMDALKAAEKLEKATLTLLDHVATVEYYKFEADTELTIDLAGYTFAIGELAFYYADVTVNDSSEAKSGAYLGTYVTFEDGASATLNGGNIYLYMNVNESVLTVNGGVFKNGLFGIVYDEESTVEINGGVFEEGLELYTSEDIDKLTFADVMHNCNVLKDENGNVIDMTEKFYDGYVSVVNTCHFELMSSKDGHWYECSQCGLKKDVFEHIDEDGDEKCDHCAFVLESKNGGGLGVGAIVGISLGGVAVVGVGGFAIFWFVIKKKSFADLIAVFKK